MSAPDSLAARVAREEANPLPYCTSCLDWHTSPYREPCANCRWLRSGSNWQSCREALAAEQQRKAEG